MAAEQPSISASWWLYTRSEVFGSLVAPCYEAVAYLRLGEERQHQLVEHQPMLRKQRRSHLGTSAWIVLHEATSPGSLGMHPQLECRRLLQAPWAQPQPALFLDRDGVLIEDRHHLCDPDQVELCAGARSLLEHADQQGWPVVVITNQSGIARGYFDWDAYERVTNRLLGLLGANAPIAAIYANGHATDAPCTSWRKPSPAMLLAASQELNLDLSRSLLIGDRLSDLKAGARAGLPWLVHVLSGHGVEERAAVEHWGTGANSDNHSSELTLLNSLLEFPCHRLQSNE